MKDCTDYKINVTKKLNFTFESVKNIVGKGEKAGSPFPTMFSKVRIVWYRINLFPQVTSETLFGDPALIQPLPSMIDLPPLCE